VTERGSRRIWCEHLSPSELARSSALHQLASRRIGLLAAVTPADAKDAGALIAACRDAGVTIGLWPMLAPHEGRWANVRTAPKFADFVERLVDTLASQDRIPDELALDLEPSFEVLSRPSPRTLARHLRERSATGRARLVSLADGLRGRGVRVHAAAMPMVLGDGPRRRWEGLLGTPLHALAPERASVMMYSSLLEGYSRGALTREDARAALGSAARLAAARGFGLSLGAVGTGILGDEPTYRGPHELADDVAIALAAGVSDLTLFSLCGALRRPPIEPWLDALVCTDALPEVPTTPRARLVWRLISAVGS